MRSILCAITAIALVASDGQAALVGHWNLNEAGGTIADSAGPTLTNSSNALLAGNYGQATVPAGSFGSIPMTAKASTALGTAINIPATDSFFMGSPVGSDLNVTNNFTAMGWMNPTQLSGSHMLFATGAGGGNGWKFGTSDDHLRFTANGVADTTLNATFPANVWQHYAVTVTGAGATFFHNGNQIGTIPFGSVNASTAVSMLLGNNGQGPPGVSFNENFNGRLDEIKIFNNVLTLAEIRAAAQPVLPGAIVVPTLNSSANLNSFNAPTFLTDNSGLSTPVNTGNTLAQASAATHIFDGGFAQSWVTNDSGADYFAGFGAANKPTFVWDLGSLSKVEDIVLWQYQNNGGDGTSIGNGTRTFELRFSDTTTFLGAADFSGTMASVLGMGGVNLAQAFDLTGVLDANAARFVELRITDNYFGQPGISGGGDRVGLGEVRFNVSAAIVVPEPASAGLILLAGAALLRRRRTA